MGTCIRSLMRMIRAGLDSLWIFPLYLLGDGLTEVWEYVVHPDHSTTMPICSMRVRTMASKITVVELTCTVYANVQ